MKRLLIFVTIFLFIFPVFSYSQVKNPNISRSWYRDLDTYLNAKSENIVVVNFSPISSASGTQVYDTLLVMSPSRDLRVTNLRLVFGYNGNPDSTVYLVRYDGSPDTLITIDTSGTASVNTTIWNYTTDYTWSASVPETLIVSGSNTVDLGKGWLEIFYRIY